MRPPSDSFQEQAGGELAIQPVGIPQFRFQGGFFLFQILQARLSSAEAQHGSLLGVAGSVPPSSKGSPSPVTSQRYENPSLS